MVLFIYRIPKMYYCLKKLTLMAKECTIVTANMIEPIFSKKGIYEKAVMNN